MVKDIPYFYYPECYWLKTMTYIANYRKYHNLEMLAKNGFIDYYDNKTILKAKGNTKKKYMKILMANKSYIEHGQIISLKDINDMIRFNCDYKELEKKRKIKNIESYLKDKEIELDAEEVYEYLKKHTIWLSEYCDMIKMAKELGYKLTKSVLYPLDPQAKHDAYFRSIQIEETKGLNKKLKKIASKYEPVNYKGLVLKILKNVNEFVDTGIKLDNCVGSMYYDQDMAKGKILIGVVYKDNEPLECLELSLGKKMEIVQLRGKNNQDSEYHESCIKCVNKFIRQYA